MRQGLWLVWHGQNEEAQPFQDERYEGWTNGNMMDDRT